MVNRCIIAAAIQLVIDKAASTEYFISNSNRSRYNYCHVGIVIDGGVISHTYKHVVSPWNPTYGEMH